MVYENYKYGKGYDNILNSGSEMDFIDQIVLSNGSDIDKSEKQLFAIYDLEYKEMLRKCSSETEKSIAKIANRRNISLVERRLINLEKEIILSRHPDLTHITNSDDLIRLYQIELEVAEKNLQLEEDTVGLCTLSVHNFPDGVIFGQERDINSYNKKLEEIEEQDRISILKSKVDLAVTGINTLYSYLKGQQNTATSQTMPEEQIDQRVI